MEEEKVALIQACWARISADQAGFSDTFYCELFLIDPSLRLMFHNDLTRQKMALARTLSESLALIEAPHRLIPAIQALGERHVGYGVLDHHYESVGAALIRALEAHLGDDLTDEARAAWIECYDLLSSVAREAASLLDEPQEVATGF